jgi:hypothetical protein
MIIKTNFLSTIIAAIMLSTLFACEQNTSHKEVITTENIATGDPLFIVDTFSTFPKEIDGCSCYYAKDSLDFKAGHYIYLNDYAKISFVKINGVVTKFTQTESKEIDANTTTAKYHCENYEMKIETKSGKKSGEETMLKTGTFNLTDKKGTTVSMAFYGECGC